MLTRWRPGFVATEAGVPVAVLAFTVVNGRITAIDALGRPTRLAELALETSSKVA